MVERDVENLTPPTSRRTMSMGREQIDIRLISMKQEQERGKESKEGEKIRRRGNV